MSHQLLLPNKFKLIGWCLLIPAAISGVVLSLTHLEILPVNAKVFAFFYNEIFSEPRYFSFIKTNIASTIVGVLFIVGAMFVGFSKEKREDEFIGRLRLSSLLWAVWVNYFLLLLSFVFVYGTAFFTVMVYNMFTILIIFIIRFNYILYTNSKTVADEE